MRDTCKHPGIHRGWFLGPPHWAFIDVCALLHIVSPSFFAALAPGFLGFGVLSDLPKRWDGTSPSQRNHALGQSCSLTASTTATPTPCGGWDPSMQGLECHSICSLLPLVPIPSHGRCMHGSMLPEDHVCLHLDPPFTTPSQLCPPGPGGSFPGGVGRICATIGSVRGVATRIERLLAMSNEATSEDKTSREVGNALFVQGDVQGAKEAYLRALDEVEGGEQAHRKELLRLHLNLCACELRLGGFQKVLFHSEKALKLDGRCAKAYFRRAKALLQLDDVPAALCNAQAAQQLSPKDPDVQELVEESKKKCVEQGWDQRLEEQAKVLEAKRVVAKLQSGEELDEKERETLHSFRCEEIGRLEEKKRTEGISGEEMELLRRLQEAVDRETKYLEEMEELDRRAAHYLEKVESGRRVPIRDRMNVSKMMEEEEERLRKMDDEVGLSQAQLKVLRDIQEFLRQRNAKRRPSAPSLRSG